MSWTEKRSIKDFGLSESRRAVGGGSEISPTGLGVLCLKRIAWVGCDGLSRYR